MFVRGLSRIVPPLRNSVQRSTFHSFVPRNFYYSCLPIRNKWTSGTDIGKNVARSTCLHFSSEVQNNQQEFPFTPPLKTFDPCFVRPELAGPLLRIINYIKDPQKVIRYDSYNIRPTQGLILTSVVGVGIRQMVHWCADTANVPLIITEAEELDGKKIRALFRQGNERQPSIICIQNMDRLAAALTPQLLQLVEDIAPGVIFMGTSMSPDEVASELFRTGRIDQILLHLPDQSEREALFEVHLRDRKCGKICYQQLAVLSEGFPDEKIAAWVDRAACLAYEQQSEEITDLHFERARNQMLFGAPRASKLTPEQRELVAYHEAGHALIGVLLGYKIRNISLQRYGGSLGSTEWEPYDVTLLRKEQLVHKLLIALGGIAAGIVEKKQIRGNKADLDRAKQIASIMISDGMAISLTGIPMQEVEVIVQQHMEVAKQMIEKHKKALYLIANALESNDQLNGQTWMNLRAELAPFLIQFESEMESVRDPRP